jgi:aryl-alcohol dehydrogenase-like predicted oxidoreductase
VIEQAPFGRTGHASSRVIFGAAALSRTSQESSDAILESVLAGGVNHIDTAANYGESELRLAPFLRTHRDEIFLATKTAERTAGGARASVERSLERLGVDSVDLIQLHNLVEDDEWDVAFSPTGVVAGLQRAQEEGLVRFIGVTGHGLRIPRVHLRSLERYRFDAVLFPYNFTLRSDPDYRRDADALLERCGELQVAVQTIKSIARRRWEDRPTDAPSWYEPITEDAAIGRAVAYVLSQPQLFLNSSSDYRLLETVLRHANGPQQAPSDESLAADVAALEITPLFDGAALERI